MHNTDVIDTTTWETEIKGFMTQLGYSKYVKDIISEVKATAKGNESNDLLYDRAWRRFKNILLN
jgi:hypothetical protein